MATRTRRYGRTTDQTDGFADCGRRDVTACMDWFTTHDAESERFVTVDRGSYRTDRVTRWIDTRYTLTQRKSFNSQRKCMAAWEDRKFPRHNVEYSRTHGLVAVSYSSDNFTAYHHVDGTGRVEHYSTLAAVRTRHDTVINNSQDYGNGFARRTPASDAEGTAPLTTIRESGVLPDGMDVYDLHERFRDTALRVSSYTGVSQRETRPELLTLTDDSGLVIVDDPSAKNHNENTAMFHVTAGEIRHADTVRDLGNLLVPQEVRESGKEIVPTNAMVPHTGRRNSADTSRYDDAGEVIQRQGEWFFVPVGDLESTAGGLSHTTGVPRECEGCSATRFDVTDDSSTCKECGHVHVTDTDAGPDVLGSHRPTHYAPPARADGGENDDADTFAGYVRGTVRHTAEHYMARLGEVWHRAIQHGRDVVVVDTSTPAHGRGGRGMRWD